MSAVQAGPPRLFGDALWDLGLLYGRAASRGHFHGSISTGVAVVSGTRGGIFDRGTESVPATFGLPIDATLSWRPLGWAGFGACLFANLNHEEHFFGGSLGLEVGRLGRRRAGDGI